MTYISVPRPNRWPILLASAVLSVAVAACGDSSSGSGGGGGAGGIEGPMGCLVQNFRGEPDILFFPEIEARSLQPGATVGFTIFVDSDTRLVKATFMDAWRLRDNPQGQSETLQVPTTGNVTLDLAIPINTTGRYYVDLELCGSDCNEQRVIYTLNRGNAGPGSDAINDPYERILFQGDQEIRTSFTCDNPDSIAIQ